MAKVIIETDRLVLRQFKSSDAGAYFKMTRDSAIKEYIPYGIPINEEDARNLIDEYYSQRDYYLVLENKKTHEFIGALIANQNKVSEYELCLMIATEHRNKGYITEATKAFIKNLPPRTVLIWEIRNDNEASLKAVSKIENVYEADIYDVEGYEEYYFREFKCTVQ